MSAERSPTVVEQILGQLSRVVGRDDVTLPAVRRPNWCPGAMVLDGGKRRRPCSSAVAVQKVEDRRDVPDNEREPARYVTLGLCWACEEADSDMRAGLREQAMRARMGDQGRSGRRST